MLVTLEGRREPAEDRRYPENNYAFSDDGFPAEAVVPVVVARVADPVPVRVEVQVLEQFVSGASVQDGAAHLRDGFREHRGIRGHPLIRGYAVAIQVMADGIELRQGPNLDQPVIVGVVIDRGRRPHRNREALGCGRVRSVCIGRRCRDGRMACHHRRDRDLGPGHAHGRDGRCGRGGCVGQRIVLRVPERPRDIHHHGRSSLAQCPVRHRAHRYRRLIGPTCDHRHPRATRPRASRDHRLDLVPVAHADAHLGIGVLQYTEILCQGFDRGAVVAGEDVGETRRRVPVARRHRRPAQIHLSLSVCRRRRQSRAHPELVAEFLPRRLPIPVQVHRQNRILGGRPEAPGIVGRAIAVQVQIPVPINAMVAGGGLQGVGRLARHAERPPFFAVDPAVVVLVVRADPHAHPGCVQVPIARISPNIGRAADQPPDRRLAGDRPRGVARPYRAAGISDQPPDAALTPTCVRP